MNIKRLVAVSVVASLLSGCATAGTARVQSADRTGAAAPQSPADLAVLAEYVQKLPLGSKVRVDRVKGGALTGTLMKATSDSIIVQRHTRVPEPPETIPLDQVLAVRPQAQNGGVGKAIGVGAAAGAGAAVGVIVLLIAIFSD